MLWIFTSIFAYFFFALASIIDRHILTGPLPKPKVYAFYISSLGFLALVLLPFNLAVFNAEIILLSLFAGVLWIFAMFTLYVAISKIEISRVVPSVGAFLPVFTFIIYTFIVRRNIFFGFWDGVSLFLLILGGVIISSKDISLKFFFSKSIFYPLLAAFCFSVGFYFRKLAFMRQTFISAIVWTCLGGALVSLFLLLFSDVRKNVFSKKPPMFRKENLFLVIMGYGAGAIGSFLQAYSLYLAKEYQVPFINALEGLKYVFVLFFSFLISLKSPRFLKEDISPKALGHKLFFILVIISGLLILLFR